MSADPIALELLDAIGRRSLPDTGIIVSARPDGATWRYGVFSYREKPRVDAAGSALAVGCDTWNFAACADGISSFAETTAQGIPLPESRGLGFCLVFYPRPDLAPSLRRFLARSFETDAGLPPALADAESARLVESIMRTVA